MLRIKMNVEVWRENLPDCVPEDDRDKEAAICFRDMVTADLPDDIAWEYTLAPQKVGNFAIVQSGSPDERIAFFKALESATNRIEDNYRCR